jgi:hypothetical protein
VAGCEHEADTSPLVRNGRQLPFYIGQGAIDELVFSPSAVEQSQRFDTLGYRYRIEVYARQGHVSWAETGHFEGAVAWMRDLRRAPTPARIAYTFYASHQRPDLGTGPSGVWWLSGLRARLHGPGALASADAVSHALPDDHPSLVRSTDALTNTDGPAAVKQLVWGPAAPSLVSPVIDLDLRGVAAATVDVAAAGLTGPSGSLHVRSDGPVRLLLTGIRPHSTVTVGATGTPVVSDSAVLRLSGSVVVRISPARQQSLTGGSLAATGPPDAALVLAGSVLLLALVLVRRPTHSWSTHASS